MSEKMTREEVIQMVVETGRYEASPKVNLDRIHQILSDGECSPEMKTAKKYLDTVLDGACSDLHVTLPELLAEASFSENIRLAAFSAMMRRAETMTEVNDVVEFLMLYCLCRMLDETAANKAEESPVPGALTGYLADTARYHIRKAEASQYMNEPPADRDA